jgi:hypothetical protein
MEEHDVAQEPEDPQDFAALIDFHPYRDRFEAHHRIPAEPRSRDSILAELGAMAEEEDRMEDAGRVSGSIYHGGHDHYRFLTEVYGLFATGFAIMACLPVVLDWSAIHAGNAREGAAAGFLLMSGNLGGVVLVLVIQGVMGNAYVPFVALAIISLLGLPLALGLPGRSVVGARAVATFDGER